MKKLNANEFQELITSGDMVLVDFYADWCGPCKMLTPILEKISNNQEKIKFVKINVDNERSLSEQLGIRSLPTVKLFKDGKMIDDFVGFKSEKLINDFLMKHI